MRATTGGTTARSPWMASVPQPRGSASTLRDVCSYPPVPRAPEKRTWRATGANAGAPVVRLGTWWPEYPDGPDPDEDGDEDDGAD